VLVLHAEREREKGERERERGEEFGETTLQFWLAQLARFTLPISSANFGDPFRVPRCVGERHDGRIIPDVSDRCSEGLFLLPTPLVFRSALLARVVNFLISRIGGLSSETLTRIKEEPGTDDGQRTSLPLWKNQPLQYQGVAATAVSR